jgi:cytoskeletal protein CcmA (bactofilin family)
MREKENDMFEKAKVVDQDQAAVPQSTANVMGRAQQSQPSAVARPTPTPESPEAVSSISSEMAIVGNLVCKGVVKVFGRIEGELQGSNVLIYDGGQVDGNVVAQEVTVGGRVKGNIRANRVKLQGTALVEGDIFHQSLAIEENARFEGSSRRVENFIDAPSSPQAKGLHPRSQAQPQTEPQPRDVMIEGKGKVNDKPRQ